MEPGTPLHQLSSDIDSLGDDELVTHVMAVLATPPSSPADSFVLHAPLELMARAELLPAVEPGQRDAARRRIIEVAVEWTNHAPHVPVHAERPASSLSEAIAAGDIDEADRGVVALAAQQSIDEFVSGAGSTLLSHLGGAGHLAIFLDQLARLHRASHSAIASGRALVRDLARHPDWVIGWIDNESAHAGRAAHTFIDVLANPPSAGDPGSKLVYPTMHLVDANGMAAELLTVPAASLTVDQARRQLLRIAAMSMLQDDPAHAPYGWSHCLTMPQAALAVAPRTSDPRRAIAVASTYVLGFRATLSETALDLDWEPPRPRHQHRLLDTTADGAIAQAWHTEYPDRIERELATYAATHHDAHLAKYTLACRHAAHGDPDAAPLYRAAAARLATWWRDSDTRTA